MAATILRLLRVAPFAVGGACQLGPRPEAFGLCAPGFLWGDASRPKRRSTNLKDLKRRRLAELSTPRPEAFWLRLPRSVLPLIDPI